MLPDEPIFAALLAPGPASLVQSTNTSGLGALDVGTPIILVFLVAPITLLPARNISKFEYWCAAIPSASKPCSLLDASFFCSQIKRSPVCNSIRLAALGTVGTLVHDFVNT